MRSRGCLDRIVLMMLVRYKVNTQTRYCGVYGTTTWAFVADTPRIAEPWPPKVTSHVHGCFRCSGRHTADTQSSLHYRIWIMYSKEELELLSRDISTASDDSLPPEHRGRYVDIASRCGTISPGVLILPSRYTVRRSKARYIGSLKSIRIAGA